MAEQFEDIIRPRIDQIANKAAVPAASKIDERMKANTEQGVGFGADQYDATYSRSHARRRRKKGLQTDRVDLRMNRRRIEQTNVTKVSTGAGGARIAFQEAGHIFKMHHDGTAKGDKTRSIWPKTPKSIPDDITTDISKIVGGVLRGQ